MLKLKSYVESNVLRMYFAFSCVFFSNDLAPSTNVEDNDMKFILSDCGTKYVMLGRDANTLLLLLYFTKKYTPLVLENGQRQYTK